jgi:hypothetical protein
VTFGLGNPASLAEAGIDKNLAKKARQLAAMEKEAPGAVDNAIVKATIKLSFALSAPFSFSGTCQQLNRQRPSR